MILRIPVGCDPLLGRPPRRRGRNREVPDQRRGRRPRRSARRRLREALRDAATGSTPRRHAAGGTRPSAGRRAHSRGRSARPGRASARCSTAVGARAEQRAIDLDRVVDVRAALEPLRLVVGKLVHDDVGPHLKGVDARRRACATAGAAIAMPNGAAATRREPSPGRSRSRRRASGSATPAQTAPQASMRSGRPRRRRPEVLRRRLIPPTRAIYWGGRLSVISIAQ